MLTNSYPNFVEVRTLPLPTATAVQLVQELIDMNILQHKPGSSSKSNSIFAAIKSRVNRPAPKSKFAIFSLMFDISLHTQAQWVECDSHATFFHEVMNEDTIIKFIDS